MAVLTHDKILTEMKKGNIKIEPFSKDQVGPASIDLHLGNRFRIFKREDRTIHVSPQKEPKVEEITVPAKIKNQGYLLVRPGKTVLGITKEKITLSPNLCAWLEGRSRFARIGLGVHVTSGFIQPGVSNHQLMEITNVGPNTIALYPDTRICQLVIERCEGRAKYKGKFKDQKEP